MNELERIIEKYFLKDSEAITYSNFDQNEVNKLFKNMGIYERPDILSFINVIIKTDKNVKVKS